MTKHAHASGTNKHQLTPRLVVRPQNKVSTHTTKHAPFFSLYEQFPSVCLSVRRVVVVVEALRVVEWLFKSKQPWCRNEHTARSSETCGNDPHESWKR